MLAGEFDPNPGSRPALLGKPFSEWTRTDTLCHVLMLLGAIGFTLSIIGFAMGGMHVMLCALLAVASPPLAVASLGLRKQQEVKPIEAGRLSLSADYFMPYSECPKCGIEALHWVTMPDRDEAKRLVDDYTDQVDAWHKRQDDFLSLSCGRYMRPEYGTYHSRPRKNVKTALAIEVYAGNVDVIRECRGDDCSHVWGQRVGALLDEVKAA